MTSTPTARLAICCCLFLVVFFFTSSLDFSLVVSVSLYLFLTKAKYVPVFIATLTLFFLAFIFDYFDLTFRFISDLFVDGYILLIVAVVLYLGKRKDLISLLGKVQLKEKKIISQSTLLRLILSFVLYLLLFPTFGGYLAAIGSYFFFSYLIKQFNGKIAIVIALVLLVTAAFFLIIKKNTLAEELGNYTYFFLLVGTVQEIVILARDRRVKNGEKARQMLIDERKKKQKSIEQEAISALLIKEGSILSKKGNISLPRITMEQVKVSLFVAGFLLLTIIAFWYLPKISLPKISLSLPPIKLPLPRIALLQAKPSPTLFISPKPTQLPTPTLTTVIKMTEEFAKLAIFIQNGTNIRGLAASTSAILQKEGFDKVAIGNAPEEHLFWEIAMKEKNDNFVSLIKQLLKLSTLEDTEATIPAAFDVLIVAGEKK